MKILILAICATVLVGASAVANTLETQTNSLRVGIFNSQQKAQIFFESLPDDLKQHIHRDQLWVNAYQTPSGLTEHHLEISALSVAQSKPICDFVKQLEIQCFTSKKSKLPVSSFAPKETFMTAARMSYTPHMLGPLGLRIQQRGGDDLGLMNLALLDGRFATDSQKLLQQSVKAHGDAFTLSPQSPDTPEARALKAAYEAAKHDFITALQSAGAAVNAGDGSDAAQEQLMVLGQKAFEAAGSAYLSGFLSREAGTSDALASDTSSGKAFIYHAKKNLGSSAKQTVQSIISDAISGDGDLGAATDSFMLSGARGLIDVGLSSARRSDLYALRNLELEYRLNDFADSYFSVLTTQPIYQSADLRHNVFLQGGGIINEQSIDVDDDEGRHTLNLGAAYRYLTVNEKYLFGGNIFFDHQWPYNHSRIGLGVDAKAEDLNFAANYYYPLTDFRDSRIDRDGNQYEERALEGYDIELGYQMPFLPELSVFGKGYQYFRETDDDILGAELTAEYDIRDNFTIRGSVVEENGGRDGIEFALQYRVPLYDPDKPNLALAEIEAAAGDDSQRSRIFEKVRRENRIRVEERLKAVDAGIVNVSAQFNALSTGLPFDVGGTATGAAINLPFDTAITVPNGDFGIINFSNGAIANVSASGGGDVILEFNNNSLTVTATNGGFVQFISAGGGINTVNVPGGVVNLLGTDIDVTDDGATTTIQVRAGQIEVVPAVGVAVLNGNQSNIISLGIATGATSLLVNPALETRQEAAFTNLDLINPDPPDVTTAAPYINALPTLITGPQFVGNETDLRFVFTQPVTVAGAPFVNGLVGANARTFAYNAGASSATQLVFRHTFIAGDVGAANITINDIDLNGGTIIGTGNTLNAIRAFTDTVVAISDTTAPSLVSSTPVDNESAFSRIANIVLNFNENIQAGIGNIVLTDTSDGSSTTIIPIGDPQVSITGSTLTLNPTANLDLGNDYDLVIASNVIQDTSGNAFTGIASGNLNFTTSSDTTPPMLTSSSPTDNATQIARNSTITLTFNEDVALAGTINLIDTDNGTGTVAYTSASPEVNVTNNVITITPAANLEYAENYEVTWAAGAIQDVFGNNAVASNSGDLNFQTVNLEASLALTLNITAPSENIDPTNVQASGVTIDQASTFVMAMDITIPVAPSGLLFECGGAGQGQYVGFNTTDSVLRFRGGEGGNAPPDTDMTFLDVPFASITAGSYTLTFEYEFTTTQIRAWLDETLLGSATAAGGALENNQWAGGDECTFVDTSLSGLTVGEDATQFNGTLDNTNVRYYRNQTLP